MAYGREDFLYLSLRQRSTTLYALSLLLQLHEVNMDEKKNQKPFDVKPIQQCSCIYILWCHLEILKCLCPKLKSNPKRFCSTNQLTILQFTLSECVWTSRVCVCVYRVVIRGRVMSVSVLSLLVDPVMVTAIPVSPSKRCCLRTHADTQRSDIFNCKGNSTVSVKGKANRMGDFKCLPWVTTQPPSTTHADPTHTQHLVCPADSSFGSQHAGFILFLTGSINII